MNTMDLLRVSEKHTKNRFSWPAYFVWRLTGNRCFVDYLVVYAYLKWVDDVIDQRDAKETACLDFLDRQIAIVFHGKAPTVPEEEQGFYLHGLLKQATSEQMAKATESLFSVFYRDVYRKHKLLGTWELRRRHDTLGQAAILLCELIFAGRRVLAGDIRLKIARIYIVTDVFLDLREDVSVGYYNLPRYILQSGISEGNYATINRRAKAYAARKAAVLAAWAASMEERLSWRACGLILKFFLRRMLRAKIRKLEQLQRRLNDDCFDYWPDELRQDHVGSTLGPSRI